MWKKIALALTAFIGSLSVAYAYYNSNLQASGATYVSGGNATGRVNKAPNNLSGGSTNIHMQKGDRYYLGKNTAADQSPIGWQLLTDSIDAGTVSEPSWLAMTTRPIKQQAAFNTVPTYYIYDTPTTKVDTAGNLNLSGLAAFDESNLYPTMNTINAQWTDSKYQSIIGTYLTDKIDIACNQAVSTFSSTQHRYIYTMIHEYRRTTAYGKNAFIMPYFDVFADSFVMNLSANTVTPTYALAAKDLKFTVNGSSLTYFFHDFYAHSSDGKINSFLGVNGSSGTSFYESNTITNSYAVRPAIFMQKDAIVFAVSQLTGSGSSANITEPKLSSGYTNISTDAVGDTMKIRYYDSAMKVSFDDLLNLDGGTLHTTSGTYQTAQGSKIKVKANGNTSAANSSVSALIFNQSGNFIGYTVLGKAKGSSADYEFDVSTLPIGTYQIAVVNEVYDNTDMDAAKSSLLSDVKMLSVISPLSNLKFQAEQNLVYQTNVNIGDTVGTITSSGGAGTAVYEIVEDSAYPGEHSNLTIGSDGKSVVVKNQALAAATYHFKIQAKDANGDPRSPLEIPATITVKKDTLNVAFDQPNQTKKSISDAGTAWNETATATPSTGIKITYSVSGGDVGLIDIDPNTGAITYKGGNAFGKVKIKATADDDPTNGSDNYDPIDAEKEIVIYREVDGNVTPDNNSSDSTIPTFSASDPNVKTNGIIGTIQGTLGTPDTLGGSTTTYTYGIKTGVGDANFFSVDPNTGVIKATANLGVKGYSITVTVSDKWSTKEIPVSINVGVANAEDLKFYENSTSNTVITTQSAKITDTNVFVYATVKGSSNMNPVTYKVKDGSTNVVEVNSNSGKIDPKGVGSVTIVAEKAGDSGQANASAELTFTVTAGEQNFIYTDATLSNELPKSGDHYDPYVETYQNGKNFQLYTTGYPTDATVTYQLKAGSPTDVISVDSNGLVHILNASITPSQIGKVIVEATSHDPSGSYSDKTIELPINIAKADQTISFADITYAASGKGKVTPVINEQDISSNDGGVQINDTDYYITIDSSINTAVAWTNNGVDIEYDFNGEDGLDIPLHVEKAGNRNYNKAEADGSMRIMGPDESTLAINRPGKIIYGDHFEIKSLQDDSSSTNVQYQFEVDNTTYISNPTVNGHKAEFDALRFSGKTNINIKVTRTADGETPLSKTISVQVLPKEIEITIDDKDKYRGEENPPLTYQDFKSQLVTWNGVQDVIQEHDIKLSTTAQTNSQAGNYPIKGDANSLNNTYPNYSFKFVEGTLTIKEDNIEDDWYHMEIADGSHTPYSGDWTNQNVEIISDHAEYVNLSLDQSTWSPQKVTVSKEGETSQSFWMKKDSGAITKEKQEIIRIDKTPPKVKGIKAKDTNNKVQNIINQLSGGIFFQPGTAFEITTSDKNSTLKVSETKEISYKIYMIDNAARSGEEEISNGTLSVTNDKASITISETTGTYRVCVIPTDHAGNTGEESCHEVTLKKIDVDVDGDGKPDFNDPDGDGCPDLNIKWKDTNDPDKWIIINGDRDYDGIPDLNIDSDGDGKPDLNIDTDNDSKPDLNLVILKKSVWKPTKCVKQDIDNGILEEYCTGTTVKAAINVDLDGDYIPDINIDNKGDFKPHINISKDGRTPSINIAILHEWKPDLDKEVSGFSFDTMVIDEKKEILLNIDTDDDGRPDVNIDLDGNGKPDLNVDTDFDWIPNINIDSTGNGKPDINIDTDKDGNPNENIVSIKEWKPERNVDGDFPYDTMDITVSQEPSNPGEPQEPQDPAKSSQQGTHSTSVQGNYNPQESMGGANTGDITNLMMYLGMSLVSLGMIFLVIYKKKAEN